MEKPILQDSPSFVDLCTLHQHAMRYYRLWIYACNTVLALATLVFTVFAVSVLVDPRITLLTGVELYQPTFLYAYVALLLQCGVLQAIGCVGAIRLNQRLLNTYWRLLLALMIGDIFVGVVWAFRLDQIKSSLRPMLKTKLESLYGKDQDFTEVWDWVQTNDMCCGVDGPIDFQRINESTFGAFDTNGLANDTWASYLLYQQERLQQPNQQSIPKFPSTCCVFTMNPITTTDPPLSSENPGGGYTTNNRRSHHHTNTNKRGQLNKVDRWNTNDLVKPPPGAYYLPPQQLKSSFHNNNPFYSENLLSNGSLSSTSITSTSSSDLSASNYFNNNNLIISDLRKLPLTDSVAPGAAGYPGGFGVAPQPQPTGGAGTHNRRKVSQQRNHRMEEYPYVERTKYGSRPTTTDGPSGGRPSTAALGECVLPTHLRQPLSSSSSSYSSNYNSMEGSGGGSFEDSVFMSGEQFSTTSLPPPSSTPTTESAAFSTDTPQPPMSTISPPPKSKGSPTSSSSSNSPPYPFPFKVSMEQHTVGCGDKILEWVEHSSDVLFVIGFCIIVFLKGCFIAILRYEIKEMIEKIKLLNGEDEGRTAAMNELIGLTSMYESGNDDSGEREGLMAGVHGTNLDTSNTNVDTIDPDNATAIPSSIGTTTSMVRKDSIHFVKENHLIGNNVQPPRYIGNHVGVIANPNNNDDYPRVLAVTRDSISSPNNKHDIEEDFDSGSALLGYKHTNDSPIGNNKHYHHHHHLNQYPHRNENGGRGLPRNGNNNNAIVTSMDNAPVGVPTSASAPLPIDAIARVTHASIH